MSPETWFVIFLFVLVTIPVFIGAIVVVNRATGDDAQAELEELRERVEELESEQD